MIGTTNYSACNVQHYHLGHTQYTTTIHIISRLISILYTLCTIPTELYFIPLNTTYYLLTFR